MLRLVSCSYSDVTPFHNGLLSQPRLSIWYEAGVNNGRALQIESLSVRRNEAVSSSSIRVSESLMAELQRAGDVEQRSPEEVVEDAVERYLHLSRRKRLYAYGEAGFASRKRICPRRRSWPSGDDPRVVYASRHRRDPRPQVRPFM
jgi:predicted transcriptional regulator